MTSTLEFFGGKKKIRSSQMNLNQED